MTITGVAAADVADMITSVAADSDVHTLAIGVSDTAAHIAATLDMFNASQVQAVTISDSGALVFTASAAANGASALGKLTNQNGAPISLIVSDNAAQVSANFSSLIGIVNLAAIAVTDNGALTLTGAQVRDGGVALGKTIDANGATPVVDVVDSAAGLEANGVLDALENNNDVASIIVSGGPLVVSVMQLVADGDVIAEMTNSSASLEPVTVADSAVKHRRQPRPARFGRAGYAIQLLSGGQITLNVLQLGAYLPALGELQGATLIIKDTAAALQGALDQLQSLGALVSSVVVSNNLPMTISATQVVNDSVTLAKLSTEAGWGSSTTLPIAAPT